MDKIDFWDKKILIWEKNKYAPAFFPYDFNSSVKLRKIRAVEFLKKYGRKKSILEIGCGSGTILPYLKDSGISSYTGIDFSSVAIQTAQGRQHKHNFSFPINLMRRDLSDLAGLNFDLIFSLGVVDWLKNDEAAMLFQLGREKIWFHSFSSANPKWIRRMHSLYVHMMYGKNSLGYVPRYLLDSEIISWAPQGAKIFWEKGLGITRFGHNLDL